MRVPSQGSDPTAQLVCNDREFECNESKGASPASPTMSRVKRLMAARTSVVMPSDVSSWICECQSSHICRSLAGQGCALKRTVWEKPDLERLVVENGD